MQQINARFAGNNYTTDVLSFVAGEETGPVLLPPASATFLGDIVISLPQATRQARTAANPVAREVDMLLAHGMLHVLGYDHSTRSEAIQMNALQSRVLGSQA